MIRKLAIIPLLTISFTIFAQEKDDKEQDKKLQAQIEQLIKKLDDDNPKTRRLAQAELVKIGVPALKALQKAMKSKSLEVKSRAEQTIKQIEWQGADNAVEKYDKRHKEENLRRVKLEALDKLFKSYRFYQVWEKETKGDHSKREYYAVKKYTSDLIKIDTLKDLSSLLKKEKKQIELKNQESADSLAKILKMVLCRPDCTNLIQATKTEKGWQFETSGTFYRSSDTKHSFKVEIDKDKKLKSIKHTINSE